MKAKTFEEPYKHIETNTPEVSLLAKKGNTIYAIEIDNKVTVLSSNKQGYEDYHNYLNQIISTIGEGYTLQKTDIFFKEKYHVSNEELDKQEYLQQQYQKHFDGRIAQSIKTVISVTEKTKKVQSYNKKKMDELFETVQKVYRILDMAGLKPRYLSKTDYEYYFASILTQDFSKEKLFNNIKVDMNHIDFGDKVGVCLPFFDYEKVELPNEIDSYVKKGSDQYDTIVDNFTFLGEIQNYETMIFTQYIEIPDQTKSRNELEKKKNRHQGLSSEKYNSDCADEIDDFISDVEKNGDLIVKCHMNLFVTAGDEEKLKEVVSLINTKMFQKGISLNKSMGIQKDLFMTLFLGMCASDLDERLLFKTSNNIAVAFFFKECFMKNDISDFYLTFADRKGIPVKVDIADLPMQRGQITNRNKIILGPSGTGKSFLVNNIFEQYLQFNYDVVVIDVGDSYASLCKFFKGKYITYTEENPISMNPFKIKKSELNEEKQQTLVELLWIIWQGVTKVPNKTEFNVINELISEYYKNYFDLIDTDDKTTDQIIIQLAKYGISKDKLKEKIEIDSVRKDMDYYTILGLTNDSSNEEIKKAWRLGIKENHPDTNRGTYNKELVEDINKAYRTLINPKLKKEYDSSLIISEPEKVVESSSTKHDEIVLRDLACKETERITREFKVKDLSLNSLYEFANHFLPKHLEGKKLKKEHFDTDEFLYNLMPFYKGGRYEKILNEEVDESLFEEKLIIFEVDNIKDNKQLFPIVTAVIIDTFIQKMRHRKNVRKALYIEEAWKAIASPSMAEIIKYLYKTVRKFYGEVAIVTQDLGDIAKNQIVSDAILGSTDIVILLDQNKMKKNYDSVKKLLNISDTEAGQIFTINKLDNKKDRSYFKEFWMRIGTESNVYGAEVSLAQYLTYTTEKPQKTAVGQYLASQPNNYNDGLKHFIADLEYSDMDINNFYKLINEINSILTDDVKSIIDEMKLKGENTNKIIRENYLQKIRNYA
jgi:type IV secretory pathway VirB4 component